MSQYISDINVSLNELEEYFLREQGFSKIHVDLNKGAGGKFIYLWYKKDTTAAITRIQFSFVEEMIPGLKDAKFHEIDKNLNAGTSGDEIHLWFARVSSEYDVPIVDLQVTTEPEDEAQQFRLGWERLACDLNRKAGGNWIHLWVKREKPTYIYDVIPHFGLDGTLFRDGFIRVDENLLRGSGFYLFLWYRQTTDPKKGLTGLKISTSDKENYQNVQYQKLEVNLREKIGGDPVHLWYKKDGSGRPLSVVSVVINKAAVEAYNQAEVPIIKFDVNVFSDGPAVYLCYYPELE